jgi:L-seryl-tRNA(Ser) seleniumtransferase
VARTETLARLRNLPSVDEVMRAETAALAVDRFGRPAVVSAVRGALAEARKNGKAETLVRSPDHFAAAALSRLDADAERRLKPVFNLTGTILHTNLGRALLAEEAIAAAAKAMREYVALEFDLDGGKRGERDDHLRGLLCELTGAEDATAVNNNAAAIMLVLNTLGRGKESIVSRGELIEIGGAFRMPEIMSRAGTKLKEIGTTNRTHKKDYIAAIGPKTGLVLKVHTSNYRIQGFVAGVSPRDLAAIARAKKIPLVNDLGSGTLVDLTRFGLAHEPTVAEAIDEGADLVTFSGDKLLGGPQAGFIVGRRELIEKINRNPMKRALRLDKIRIAALEATLRLYRDPDRLAARLPTLRLLARPSKEIEALAFRLLPAVSSRLGDAFSVAAEHCKSQTGSGALPLETIESAALVIRPTAARSGGRALAALSAAFRRLPVPVIGRIEDQSFVLDMRCLEDEKRFIENLAKLDLSEMTDVRA